MCVVMGYVVVVIVGWVFRFGCLNVECVLFWSLDEFVVFYCLFFFNGFEC